MMGVYTVRQKLSRRVCISYTQPGHPRVRERIGSARFGFGYARELDRLKKRAERTLYQRRRSLDLCPVCRLVRQSG